MEERERREKSVGSLATIFAYQNINTTAALFFLYAQNEERERKKLEGVLYSVHCTVYTQHVPLHPSFVNRKKKN